MGELYAGAFSAGAALPVSTNSRRWCRRIAHWVLHLRKLPPAFGQPRWANSIRVRPLSVGEILNDASVPTESPGPSMQRQRNSSGDPLRSTAHRNVGAEFGELEPPGAVGQSDPASVPGLKTLHGSEGVADLLRRRMHFDFVMDIGHRPLPVPFGDVAAF